jgi:hypothetical protein
MVRYCPTETTILPHIRDRHPPRGPRLLKRQPWRVLGQRLGVFVPTRLRSEP